MKQITCIDNEKFNFITVGKKYNIEKETRDFYYIINDSGLRKRYGKSRFSVDEEKTKPAKKVAKKEKIAEPMAKCVFVKPGLTYKKAYKYTESKDTAKITVTNDNGDKVSVLKKRFIFE